jgi:adenosylhomocysteine nucleosidase
LRILPVMGVGRLSQPRTSGRSSLALRRVGIICALRDEARHFRRVAQVSASVSELASGMLLSVVGMGPTAAAAGTRALIAAGARAILGWGFAGGLDPQLRCGAVLLPAEVLNTVGARIAVSEPWRDGVKKALGAEHPPIAGALLTSPTAIATSAEKARLFATSSAGAVDMESFIVAQNAQQHALPFVCLRVIIDTAADELPAAIRRAADQHGELRRGRLLLTLARSPMQLGAVARLGRRFRKADRVLASLARLDLRDTVAMVDVKNRGRLT